MEVAGGIATWFLVFIFYSMLGWCMEVVSGLVLHRKVSNRGFLIGPLCPIYGWGALIMTFFLRNAHNMVEIFFVAMLASAILEYLTSYIMEKLFRVRWWDYSHRFCNIRGRVCLANLASFGVLGIVVVCCINPILLTVFEHIPIITRIIIASIIFAIMLVDISVSLWLIIGCRVAVGTVQPDATDEITKHVREVLLDKGKVKTKLNKRLVKAFPDMEAKKRQPRAKKTNTTKPKTRKIKKAGEQQSTQK